MTHHHYQKVTKMVNDLEFDCTLVLLMILPRGGGKKCFF